MPPTAAHTGPTVSDTPDVGGAWGDLQAILHEVRTTQQPPLSACPHDGEPLRTGPRAQRFCPFCGWRP